MLETCLLVGVLSFQIWFWVQMVPHLKDSNCISYGFIFSKVVLNSDGFRIFNLLVSVTLLIVIVVFSVLRFIKWVKDEDNFEDDNNNDNKWR